VSDCHCGKRGHPLNSINCPIHGTGWRSIDGLQAYWAQAAVNATTKEMALVAFGISAGLRMAKDEHLSRDETPKEEKS